LVKVLFIINFLGYVILIKNYGLDYHKLNPKYSIITIRYSLALTSGIASATGLFLNSRLIEKQKSIKVAKRYKQLAWVILFYGLLEGLLVKVFETFSWEQEERLRKLEKHKIASEERRKLGLEIHDSHPHS